MAPRPVRSAQDKAIDLLLRRQKRLEAQVARLVAENLRLRARIAAMRAKITSLPSVKKPVKKPVKRSPTRR